MDSKKSIFPERRPKSKRQKFQKAPSNKGSISYTLTIIGNNKLIKKNATLPRLTKRQHKYKPVLGITTAHFQQI